MNYIVIIFTIASTFIALFWLSRFAYRLRLTEVPNQRKIHKETAYLIGGIAMFIGTLVGILFSSLDGDVMLHFIFVSFIITITGMLDDMYDISVKSAA
jgi:UDP-GlcNAc:undecaprenyl-phosphate GlcNAc-1-phosphate transferase